MMDKRITVELPEGAMCAFLNYVYFDLENGGMKMGALSIDTDDIDKGHVVAKPKKEANDEQ